MQISISNEPFRPLEFFNLIHFADDMGFGCHPTAARPAIVFIFSHEKRRSPTRRVGKAIAISGDKFCYQNPLASKVSQRSSWMGLACCPANLTRIIQQMGGLAYARSQRTAYVNLYAAGEAALKLDDDVTVKLAQQTDYPWNGRVRLTVTAECDDGIHRVPAHPRLGAWPARAQRPLPCRRNEAPRRRTEG